MLITSKEILLGDRIRIVVEGMELLAALSRQSCATSVQFYPQAHSSNIKCTFLVRLKSLSLKYALQTMICHKANATGTGQYITSYLWNDIRHIDTRNHK